MRSSSAAVIAVILAVLWLGAIAADDAVTLGLVTVAALAAPVLLAPRRRLRPLWIGAVGIASAIAALLVLAMVCPGGTRTLAAMVGGAIAVAVILPFVYAVTFDDDPPVDP